MIEVLLSHQLLRRLMAMLAILRWWPHLLSLVLDHLIFVLVRTLLLETLLHDRVKEKTVWAKQWEHLLSPV